VAVGLHLYGTVRLAAAVWPLKRCVLGAEVLGHTAGIRMMRNTAEPPVRYLLHHVLKVKRSTYLSSYGKVFGAFYWAYLMHVYGSILAEGRDAGD
jgi:hypothetical protein